MKVVSVQFEDSLHPTHLPGPSPSLSSRPALSWQCDFRPSPDTDNSEPGVDAPDFIASYDNAKKNENKLTIKLGCFFPTILCNEISHGQRPEGVAIASGPWCSLECWSCGCIIYPRILNHYFSVCIRDLEGNVDTSYFW